MEHRWGNRLRVNLLVQLRLGSETTLTARLVNVSVSGALIHCRWLRQSFGELDLIIGDEVLRAWVARRIGHTVGVEWSDFAPAAIINLLAQSREDGGRSHAPLIPTVPAVVAARPARALTI
jgi:hypothetical protein